MLQLEELKQALLAQQPQNPGPARGAGMRPAAGGEEKAGRGGRQAGLLERHGKHQAGPSRSRRWSTKKLDSYNSLVSMFEDAQTMVELAGEEEFGSEEEQEAFLRDIRDNLKEIDARIEEEKLSALLSGEFDSNNAILTFHAGAGGTEAPGLGADALPHVRPLVGAPPLQGQGAGLSGRGGSGHQERVDPHHRHQRLRLFEVGERRPPAGAHLAV